MSPQPAYPLERRSAGRARVACPARLDLPSGQRAATLIDLSETGARLQLGDPPPVGATALLKWQAHEVFGKVVWVHQDTCGIAFDRPIARSVVQETVQLPDEPAGPVAAVGNIPLGTRRSSRLPGR